MKIAALVVGACLATATASGPATAAPTKSEPASWCRRLPPGKRIVKLNLKPDTDLGDLVSWISSITCQSFVLPGTIPVSSKTVTIVSPQLITVEEAYGLFLTALDTLGLTVYSRAGVARIIETSKARTLPIPLLISDQANRDDPDPPRSPVGPGPTGQPIAE